MKAKKNRQLSLLCLALTFLLIINFSKAHAAPREIITSWKDIEVYDVNTVSSLANPDAPKGGTLRLTTTGSFDNFHIFAQRGRATHYFFYTYETLGEGLPGVSNVLRGKLAETFDLSEDRTELRVAIHPLAKFSDGSKVTAHDVVFTYYALLNNGNPLYQIGFDDVIGVEVKARFEDVLEVVAETDSIVLFRFKPGASRELPLEVCQLPVFSEKWWEGKDFAAPQYEPILGSGAYLVNEGGNFGVRFSLKRNPDYWAKDLPKNKGRYNFDAIIIDYFRDATIARESFFAGGSDYYSETNIKDWENAYNVEAVKNGSITKLAYDRIPTVGMMGLAINTRRPLLADKNIRRALILMMDFEWVNKSLYYNTYKRTDHYFTGHGYTLDKKPSEEELLVLNEYRDRIDPIIFEDLPELPVTDGSGNMRRQMQEAVELLKLSGYELKNGKMVNKDGNQLKFKIISSSATIQRNYGHYVQNLARIGIDMEIQLLDQNLYNAQLKNFDYDLCYAAARIALNPGNELPYMFGGDTSNLEGSQNYSGVNDPIVDDIIKRMISAETLEELKIYTKVLDRILQHGMYYVPGWYSPFVRLAWWNNRIQPGNSNISTSLSTDYWHIVE